MKIIKLLLLCSIIHLNCNSQAWPWAKKVIGSSIANDISRDTSGNYFMVGEGYNNLVFNTYSVTTWGWYLTKYSSTGSVLWAAATPTPYRGRGFSVANDKQGNAYITGDFSPNTAFGPFVLNSNGYSDVFVTKYDGSGNVIWAKNFGGSDNDNGWSLTTDSIGNSYVTGTYSSPTILFGTTTLTTNLGVNSVFFTKIDSNGNVVWANKVITTGDGMVNSVAVDKFGNSYLTGILSSTMVTIGTFTLNGSGQDCFVAKIDPSGNVLWVKTYNLAVGYSISCDGSNFIYVTGGFSGGTLSLGSYTLSNPGMSDYFLMKQDLNGNVLWAREGLNSSDSYGRTVSVDNNGLYVTGAFYTNVLLDTFLLSSPTGSTTALFVCKYDFNGNLLCASKLVGSNTVGGVVVGDGQGGAVVAGTYQNGYLIIGSTYFNSMFGTNAFIAKYFCSNNIGINEFQLNNNIKVYPNPNNGNFNINNTSNTAVLVIYNSIGQEVHHQQLKQGENNILTKDLSKGLYNYVLLDNNQKIESGKLVLE